MDKVIRDGKVAVLYSPGFGAGWYSWHGEEKLLYDPVVVEMVSARKYKEIAEYCESIYGEQHSFSGAQDLRIEWVDVGREFRITEYDGSESIEYKDELEWHGA